MWGVSTHPNDRGIVEITREQLDVDGGRHEHQFEVGPSCEETLQHAQEEIPVDVPLVDLVHN